MRNGSYTKDNRSTVAGMAKAITDAAKVRDAIKKRTQRRGSPRSTVQLGSAGLRMALQREIRSAQSLGRNPTDNG